jgi:hypothetical protein
MVAVHLPRQCGFSLIQHHRSVMHIMPFSQTRALLLERAVLSGTIIRGTLKTPNSQLVTPISTKLQRSDGCD